MMSIRDRVGEVGDFIEHKHQVGWVLCVYLFRFTLNGFDVILILGLGVEY